MANLKSNSRSYLGYDITNQIIHHVFFSPLDIIKGGNWAVMHMVPKKKTNPENSHPLPSDPDFWPWYLWCSAITSKKSHQSIFTSLNLSSEASNHHQWIKEGVHKKPLVFYIIFHRLIYLVKLHTCCSHFYWF